MEKKSWKKKKSNFGKKIKKREEKLEKNKKKEKNTVN